MESRLLLRGRELIVVFRSAKAPQAVMSNGLLDSYREDAADSVVAWSENSRRFRGAKGDKLIFHSLSAKVTDARLLQG